MQIVKQRRALHASTCAKDVPDTEANRFHATRKKMKANMDGKSLTADDLMRTETAIIQYYHQERFSDEIIALKAGATVKKKSDIFKIDPVLESRRETCLGCHA